MSMIIILCRRCERAEAKLNRIVLTVADMEGGK